MNSSHLAMWNYRTKLTDMLWYRQSNAAKANANLIIVQNKFQAVLDHSSSTNPYFIPEVVQILQKHAQA